MQTPLEPDSWRPVIPVSFPATISSQCEWQKSRPGTRELQQRPELIEQLLVTRR